MLALELISDEIPPLKTSDSGLKALSWMDEFRVSHLPIVNSTEYLGLISDTDVFDLNAPDEPLGNHNITLARPHLIGSAHIYQALNVMSLLKISVLPVLDDHQRYLGLITQAGLLNAVCNISSIFDEGGIIVLELNLNDYHFSEVAQIVESNNAKILSSYITSLPDSTKLELTLKLNIQDVSAVLQTFFRYNYTVKATYHQTKFPEDFETRYNSLMNYINM